MRWAGDDLAKSIPTHIECFIHLFTFMLIKAKVGNKEKQVEVDEKTLEGLGYVKQRRQKTCSCGFDYYDRHSTHNVGTCKYKLERWLKDVENSVVSSNVYTKEYRNYLWNKANGSMSPEMSFLIGVECLQRAMEKMLQIKQIEEGFKTSSRINNYTPDIVHSCDL